MGAYGAEDSYHYPTELLHLLEKCLPLLCPGKKDVFQFFRAAGVEPRFFADWESRWRVNPKDVGKYPCVRDVLNRLNQEQTDSALRQRREIVKRVTAWENFSTLFADDQLSAKGFVTEIRHVVNVADSFTRMARERERDQKEKRDARKKEIEALQNRRAQRELIRKEIGALFAEANHQKRGKALEGLLNRLFETFDILVRESFTIRGEQGEGIIAQIDGAILLDNDFYLVEMKWLKGNVGTADISQHVTRVMYRGASTRGLFISATDFSPAARDTLRESLNYRTHVAIRLHEFIFVLENEADLKELLREKIQAAIVDKCPLRSN